MTTKNEGKDTSFNEVGGSPEGRSELGIHNAKSTKSVLETSKVTADKCTVKPDEPGALVGGDCEWATTTVLTVEVEANKVDHHGKAM